MATKLKREQRLELMRQAHALHMLGKTQRFIADELGVAQPTVCVWLRKLQTPAWTPQRRMAEKIRAELVCCDIYDRMAVAMGDLEELQRIRESNAYHDICYFGEWAARIVEKTPLS